MSLAGAQRVHGMGRKYADAREEQERNNDIHDATCFVWRHARRGNVSGVFRPVPKMVSWEPSGLANRWALPIPSLVRTSSEEEEKQHDHLAGYRKEPSARS